MGLDSFLDHLMRMSMSRRSAIRLAGVGVVSALSAYVDDRHPAFQLALNSAAIPTIANTGLVDSIAAANVHEYRLIVPQVARDEWHKLYLGGLAADGTPVPKPKYPVRPQFTQDQLLTVISHSDSDSKVVALTIDDAFVYRTEIVDEVAQYGRATLFPKGEVMATDKPWVLHSLDLGFEFGCHTKRHRDLTVALAEGSLQNEVNWPEEVIRSFAPGATLKPYLRPPGGAYNRGTVEAAAKEGYRTIMWQPSAGDTDHPIYPQQFASQIKPGDIPLTHFEGYNRGLYAQTMQLLANAGFTFVTLTELFAPKPL